MTSNATPKPQRMTFEEYLKFDDGSDRRYELVAGELVEMPPESPENCDVARRLLVKLLKDLPLTWLSYKELEIEVGGRRSGVRLPDLMILGAACRAALQGQSRGTITREMPPPLVAIEVVSPGKTNEVRDYHDKRLEYAARGIQEYWIVDPQRRLVTVLSLVAGVYEETVYTETAAIASQVIPQVQIQVNEIFQLDP